MEMDFVYWQHKLPVGIKIEEVSGGTDMSQSVALLMARQIWCENGRDGSYRSLLYLDSGAPLLEDEPIRISISHTPGLFVVASLPKTPEADLTKFNPRTALGVDTERADREQVMKIRDKFLTPEESAIVGESLLNSIIAWTAKEALYKAALTPGLDWLKDIRLISMPVAADAAGNKSAQGDKAVATGKAEVRTAEQGMVEMQLYSYITDGYVVTLAYSPKCAKYGQFGK